MTRPPNPKLELTPTLSGDSVADPSLAGTGIALPERVGGRYEILGLLGAGGMGAVYRARDTELDEVVALKMIHDEYGADASMLERFRQELRLARRVTHKNVARAFDMGEHEGTRFITMELVEGQSLAGLLAERGKLSTAEAVPILREVCAGIAAAHAAGVVHRDLKPDNILLGKTGRVVVTDFGIARALSGNGEAQKTFAGIAGTPEYMAPEQVEGASDIDGRADVYALGAMMYEMFTGGPAWTGDDPFAIAAARLTSPPPDPRMALPSMSPRLAEIIVRCMARDPRGRFDAADEISSALAELEAAPRAKPTSQGASPTWTSSKPVASGATDKTVAVLPFQNAGAPEDEYLADGITEDLIDVLSMTRGLKVRPRGVVAHLRGQDRNPQEAGRELGVVVVVQGSVRRTPTGVRANARLIGVADGFQLWARRFDRPLADALLINDEAAQAIAEALTVHFTAKPRAKVADSAAIDLYLRASHELAKFWRADVERAVALFEEALTHAPDDPTILAGAARARVRLAFFGGAQSDQLLALAKEAALRAIGAAPEGGEPWASLAAAELMAGDPAAALRAVRTALERAPNLAPALELSGRILLEAGEIDRAVANLRKALTIDPSSLAPRWELVRAHGLLREWKQADELLDLPAEGPGGRLSKYLYRSRLALWRGEDHPDFEDPPALGPEFGALAFTRLFREMLRTRELSDAHREALDEAAAKAEAGTRRRALFWQLNAEFYAYVFEIDEALASIGEAVSAGLLDICWMDRCPVLDPVRKDARFAPLRAEVDARVERVRAVLRET